MTWERSIRHITDIVLHVPPLFIMDSILKLTFPLPWKWTSEDMEELLQIPFANVLLTVVVFAICFLAACAMFMLTGKQLIYVYRVLASVGITYSSILLNEQFVEREISNSLSSEENVITVVTNNPSMYLTHIVLLVILANVYCTVKVDAHDRGHRATLAWHVLIYLSLHQPLLCRLITSSHTWLRLSTKIPIIVQGADLLCNAGYHSVLIVKLARNSLNFTLQFVKEFGIQVLFETQWTRLNIPTVLRVFWISRVFFHLMGMAREYVLTNQEGAIASSLSSGTILQIARDILVIGCENHVAVLGMTSVVSFCAHYIGLGLAKFVGSDNDEDKNMGVVTAILFFILALQTGLTGLDPEERLVRLYRNFCLLSTAILHFIHSMVNPLLMTLSASHNTSVSRHARVLTMCAFLVLLPSCFLYYLWNHHTLSTWLLAVTAFSIEVIIKVIISLLVYTLFMLDVHGGMMWDQLDDYVYYIKSTGSTIEFLFGIFLFCNGAWIMVFESGGTIRAIMMCIHAYFNIWVQAKEGWKVFMKRRTAVDKIHCLQSATKAQLEEHNDVCAICYQDLTSAKITRCNHFFHEVCLRKWLYVQDRCPLCHLFIYEKVESDSTGAAGDVPDAAQENGDVQHID